LSSAVRIALRGTKGLFTLGSATTTIEDDLIGFQCLRSSGGMVLHGKVMTCINLAAELFMQHASLDVTQS